MAGGGSSSSKYGPAYDEALEAMIRLKKDPQTTKEDMVRANKRLREAKMGAYEDRKAEAKKRHMPMWRPGDDAGPANLHGCLEECKHLHAC